MKSKRDHIPLPNESAREAVRRKKLLRFLESDTSTLKADHPELGHCAAQFVRELRQESERKQRRAKK